VIPDVEALTEEFMTCLKVISSEIRWNHAPSVDTAKCVVPVFVPSRPSFNSRLCLSAHVSRIPEKYSFTLLLGSQRVAALDVNPGRAHTNFSTAKRETVWETHWQTWPLLDHAEIDAREMSHRKWLEAFCKRFGIKLEGGYKKPPHYGGEQLRLL
jgi:hypothetical protein